MKSVTGAEECSMILVMGVTGSGKSYFINQLKSGAVEEGPGLRSETAVCQVVRASVGGKQVAIVDTPGFDDTTRSDAEILEEIVKFLCIQYELGISLKGIIYMHRITDNKMSGGAQRYFEMFKSLCGQQNLGNVVLLTTMWSELKDEAVGLARERELRSDFWNMMESSGSTIRRFDGSRAMAEAFVCRLMRKRDIVLDIQNELVEQGKRLEETNAGKLMVPRVENNITEATEKIHDIGQKIEHAKSYSKPEELRNLEAQRRTLMDQQKKHVGQRMRLQKKTGEEVAQKIENEKKKGRWRNGLSIFATLCGIAVSLSVNVILPLVGGC